MNIILIHVLILFIIVFCQYVRTSLHIGCRGCQPGLAKLDTPSAAAPKLQSQCCPASPEAGADQQNCWASKGHQSQNAKVMREEKCLL